MTGHYNSRQEVRAKQPYWSHEPWTLITENAKHRILHYCTPWSKCTSKPNIENLKNSNEALSQRANEYSMLGFHVHFDQGYSNVENRTSKKILRCAFSVISVYDLFFNQPKPFDKLKSKYCCSKSHSSDGSGSKQKPLLPSETCLNNGEKMF